MLRRQLLMSDYLLSLLILASYSDSSLGSSSNFPLKDLWPRVFTETRQFDLTVITQGLNWFQFQILLIASSRCQRPFSCQFTSTRILPNQLQARACSKNKILSETLNLMAVRQALRALEGWMRQELYLARARYPMKLRLSSKGCWIDSLSNSQRLFFQIQIYSKFLLMEKYLLSGRCLPSFEVSRRRELLIPDTALRFSYSHSPHCTSCLFRLISRANCLQSSDRKIGSISTYGLSMY